jgi:hypothetical protein
MSFQTSEPIVWEEEGDLALYKVTYIESREAKVQRTSQHRQRERPRRSPILRMHVAIVSVAVGLMGKEHSFPHL